MHEGAWYKTDDKTFEVRGKTLGILGYGSIGIRVGLLAEAHGMNVVFYDPKARMGAFGNAEQLNSQQAVLESANVVTLHVPDLESTRNLMNDESIAQMKEGSYLINASRGEVVDELALRRAIESGHLAGAAIDVFRKEQEPNANGYGWEHPLVTMRNVQLTPHIGGSTLEAQELAGKIVAKKIVDYWQTGDPYDAINLPNLEVKLKQPETRRVIYIHDNRTGALNEATAVLEAAGCNIEHLNSDIKGDIGYGYIDLASGDIDEEVVEQLRRQDTARRVRVIE